jgi:hypothetical protein
MEPLGYTDAYLRPILNRLASMEKGALRDFVRALY